jgi:hypothetical protein
VPLVRGRIIPEVESTGRAKRTLDVLLHLDDIKKSTLAALDELELLRTYLRSLNPCICSIGLVLPIDNDRALAALERIGIEVLRVPISDQTGRVPKQTADKLTTLLVQLLATALSSNLDCVVTDNQSLLAYAPEFGEVGVLLTSPDFLLRYAETFARGNDLPWSFAHKVWFEPWMSFYQLSEQWTFTPGMNCLALCQSKGADREAVELCRSLTYNRLGDLCFTRDRLCYFEMQQAVAKRAQWKRQRFSTEVAYYLNFYYVLLYGAFDHAAAFVNALLGLGIKERQVSARNPEFLEALQKKQPTVEAVFKDAKHVEFIRRIGSLRHVAAHRGVLTPTKVVKDLDQPPTNDELDQDIRNAGLEYLLATFPAGTLRDSFQEMLRSNARGARYERETLMEDVVLIEMDGKYGFIHPLNDTWWNFKSCTSFLFDVFSNCTKILT